LALNDVSFKIKPGDFVGIVGESGSGKSTIALLLLRIYEPSSGEILISNIPIKLLSREALHNFFAIIPQQNSLIIGTLLENLLMNTKVDDVENVKTICQKVYADSFIEKLENSLDTPIVKADKTFSEGQLQRLSLARTLLSNSPCIIMDEASSALDLKTEKQIFATIQPILTSKITLFITHRLAMMPSTHLILVFKDGHLVEKGTHKALLRKKKYYSLLWNLQAAAEGKKLDIDAITPKKR
jgi:ABC-type multidrug transport system fused ATPase/permease subunit